jgi:secreted trypsin-like serine protease
MCKVLNWFFLSLLLVGCNISKPTKNLILKSEEPVPEVKIFKGFDICTTQTDSYPNVVALYTMNSFVGSGVLISPYYILTAGHCIDGSELDYVKLLDGRIFCISQCIKHPVYGIGNHVLNDIGIIQLNEPIMDLETYPLCESIHKISKYQQIDISGWGATIKKQSQFRKFFFYGILQKEEKQFKVLPLNGTVWFGDSGGGVYAQINGKNYLIGIVSNFSATVVDGKLQFIENSFTRVDYYLDWILSVTK